MPLLRALIAVAGRKDTTAVLEQALKLMPLAGYEVFVLSVAAPPAIALDYTGLGGLNEQSFGEDPLGAARLDVAFAHAMLLEHGIESRVLARTGDAISQIVEVAEELNPALLILGAHHHALWERLLRVSVADSVLRRWSGSMLLIQGAPSSLK